MINKSNLTLGMALSVALLGSNAVAADMMEDDMSFQVHGSLSKASYDNSSMSSKDGGAYAKSHDGDLTDNLVWGFGGKFEYHMESISVSADANYRTGSLDFDVNNAATGATGTYTLKGDEQVDFTSIKGKLLVGYNMDMGATSMLIPSIGLGYWNSEYTKDAVEGKTNKLELKNTNISVPLGFSFKAGMGQDIAFSFDAHAHYLFSAKTTTTKGIDTTSDKALHKESTEYDHKVSGSNITDNYALTFALGATKDLSGSGFGISNIGLSGHYDYLTLKASEKVSEKYTYGPYTDSHYGVNLVIGF